MVADRKSERGDCIESVNENLYIYMYGLKNPVGVARWTRVRIALLIKDHSLVDAPELVDDLRCRYWEGARKDLVDAI